MKGWVIPKLNPEAEILTRKMREIYIEEGYHAPGWPTIEVIRERQPNDSIANL